MHVIKRLGVALLAVFALSAIAVSSASASPLFLSHPTGLLLATADNLQKFTTPAGTVECKTVRLIPPDTTPALRFLSILVGIQYLECNIPALGVEATIHPFRYLITSHGLASIDSPAVILAPFCTITVPVAQNKGLEKLTFDNNNGGVLLLALVKGITSIGEGLACNYGEDKTGTYEGNIHIKVEGGVLRWDS